MWLTDDAALAQLEAFAADPSTPRWFQKRFEYHNRDKASRAPRAQKRTARRHVQEEAEEARAGGEAQQGPTEERTGDASPSEKVRRVEEGHGLRWVTEGPWSVRDALKQAFRPSRPIRPSVRPQTESKYKSHC